MSDFLLMCCNLLVTKLQITLYCILFDTHHLCKHHEPHMRPLLIQEITVAIFMLLAQFVRFVVYSALFMVKFRTDRTYQGYLDLETQPTMDQTNLFYRKNQKESTGTATRKKKNTVCDYMYVQGVCSLCIDSKLVQL